MPWQATLRTSGLRLDVQTANGYSDRSLTQVANARVHGTIGDVPNQRLIMQQEGPAINSWASHRPGRLIADFVEKLLAEELKAKAQRTKATLLKFAGLPNIKTLEDRLMMLRWFGSLEVRRSNGCQLMDIAHFVSAASHQEICYRVLQHLPHQQNSGMSPNQAEESTGLTLNRRSVLLDHNSSTAATCYLKSFT